jgi:VWFA-related protein
MRARNQMMEKRFCIAVIASIGAWLALAASPGSAQQPAPAASAPFQLQVQVPLVLEDLVVLDRNGNPVHGLKPSDLTVTEDGKPVTVRYFAEHESASVKQTVAAPKLPDLGPNVFTNAVATQNDSSLNILLLDDLNTFMADQATVRQQTLAYLHTLPQGVPVAIFVLDNQLHLQQGFTSDRNLLEAALNANRNVVRASSMMGDEPVSDPGRLIPIVVPGMPRIIPLPEAGESMAQQRATLTMQAMNQLGRYLAGLPGRKNLIWFSGLFPIASVPDILTRSRVAIYPVDIRGLQPPPDCEATAPQLAGAACIATQRKQSIGLLVLHQTMAQLAQSTGGEAFYDTNGFNEAMKKAVSDGEHYYTFAFTPPDRKFDGRYREIDIKTSRPDLKLSYRTGYIPVDPNAPARAANSPAPSALQDSLRLSAPAATQILFAVKVNPRGASADKVSAGAKPNAALMKPPFRRFELDYRVDVSNALFTTSPDGVRHGSLDFAVFVYTPEGVLANETVNKINLDLPAAHYADMLQRGLEIGQIVEAPVKGNYFMRVLVYDPNGDRVGATEISLADLQSKQAMPDNAPSHAQLIMPR